MKETKIERIIYDGKKFISLDKRDLKSELNGKSFYFLFNYYSFWVSNSKNQYWKTIEGIPYIENINSKNIPSSERIKLLNFEKKGTLKLFPVGKYNTIFPNQNFYEIDYMKSKIKRWNYKNIVVLWEKEEDKIYLVELRLYKNTSFFLKQLETIGKFSFKIKGTLIEVGEESLGYKTIDQKIDLVNKYLEKVNRNLVGSNQIKIPKIYKKSFIYTYIERGAELFKINKKDLEYYIYKKKKGTERVAISFLVYAYILLNIRKNKFKDLKNRKKENIKEIRNYININFNIKNLKEKDIDIFIEKLYDRSLLFIKKGEEKRGKIKEKSMSLHILKKIKEKYDNLPQKGLDNVIKYLNKIKKELNEKRMIYFEYSKENPFRADLLKKLLSFNNKQEAFSFIEKQKIRRSTKEKYKQILDIINKNKKFLWDYKKSVSKKIVVFYRKDITKKERKQLNYFIKNYKKN